MTQMSTKRNSKSGKDLHSIWHEYLRRLGLYSVRPLHNLPHDKGDITDEKVGFGWNLNHHKKVPKTRKTHSDCWPHPLVKFQPMLVTKLYIYKKQRVREYKYTIQLHL